MLFTSTLKFLAALFFACSLVTAQSKSGSLIEDVTTEDVKQFLDPTVMNSVLEYRFQGNYLPGDLRLFTNKVYVGWSLAHWTAVWAEVPIHDFSLPDEPAPAGVGDVLLGWGALIHKDLTSRYTGTAVWFEALAPTGSFDKGTGLGTWILAPGGGIALNPTDTFPVYIQGRYLHSVGEIGSFDAPGGNESSGQVRSIELKVETVHIFPKGIFVSVLPSFVFNLKQDFNLFSLGVGIGRALNRKLAVVGGYVHHIAGEETFGQAFVLGLNFIWGEEKVRPDPKSALPVHPPGGASP